MAKNKEALDLREKLTESIMKTKFNNEDQMFYQSNLNILNTLTIAELQAMCDEIEDEPNDWEENELTEQFMIPEPEWKDPLDEEYIPREDDSDYYYALN